MARQRLVSPTTPGAARQFRESVRRQAPTAVVSVNADYAVQQHEATLLCDASAKGAKVTLPRAATQEGRVINVKKTDATTNQVLIKTYHGETIGGNIGVILQTAETGVTIQSDGKRWFVVNQNFT